MPVTNQEIKDKLEGIEDAIVGGVKKIVVLPLWVKIVAGAGLLCLIILIVALFRKQPSVNNDYLKEIAAKDSTIKYQEKYIKSLETVLVMKDSIIIKELGRISGNKTTQNKLKDSYDKIPAAVNSLDRDGLRREWSEY